MQRALPNSCLESLNYRESEGSREKRHQKTINFAKQTKLLQTGALPMCPSSSSSSLASLLSTHLSCLTIIYIRTIIWIKTGRRWRAHGGGWCAEFCCCFYFIFWEFSITFLFCCVFIIELMKVFFCWAPALSLSSSWNSIKNWKLFDSRKAMRVYNRTKNWKISDVRR